jgi:hypothetical protein
VPSPLTRIGDRLSSSLPARKLVAALSRGGPESRGAFVAAPVTRLNLVSKRSNHLACKLVNTAECHRYRLSSLVGFDTDQPSEENRNAFPENRTFGS